MMNPLSLLPDSESAVGLYYLIPFSQIHLYQMDGNQLYLHLGVVSFFSAIGIHTYFRAVYGPGLDDNDTSSKLNIMKRIMTTLLEDKKPFAQPESVREAVTEQKLTPKQNFRLIAFLLVVLTISGTYLYSLHEYWIMLSNLELIGQLITLGLVFPVIEYGFNQIWIPAYIYPDEIPDFSDD